MTGVPGAWSGRGPHLAAGRVAGLVRLGHPFPSLVTAGATLSLASLAGGAPTVALRLAASMLALQVSIGALNDLVDAAIDSGRKPGKPIPRGVVQPATAALVAVVSLGLGLALSAPSGLPTLGLAVVGVGCGYLYDVRLSRTPWSWLPLAIALPLVPLHAWLGATGSAPPDVLALVPIAALAGAGLAIGNGLADAERDRAAGLLTTVVALGRSRAWLVHGVALAGAVAGAFAVGPPAAADWALVLRAAGSASIAAGVILVGAAQPSRRERGWELEAIGVAALGAAWLAGAVVT
jgi:4-hydroxybenzoate polyprenyltransferase